MTLARIYIIVISLLFNNNLSAQKKIVKSVEWKKIGMLPETNGKPLGFAGVVAGVTNNMFIAGGGANFPDSMPWLGGSKKYYDDLYVYQKNEDDSLILFRSFKLPFPLGYAACVSTKSGIVIAGGENDKGISNKVMLLQWDTVVQKIVIRYLPDLPYPLSSAGIAEHDRTLYIAGGDMGSETSGHFLSLNTNTPGSVWKEMPALPQPTSHAVFLFTKNGQKNTLFLIGGRKKNYEKPSSLYKDVYVFDLKMEKWEIKSPLPYALSAGTGAVANNTILLFGGDTGETFHKTEELILAIAEEKDDTQKKPLTLEKIKVQSEHPGFCAKELEYIVSKDQWKGAGCIPFKAPVTTVAVPWNDEVIIAGGEIRAGVRTPQILSAKIN